MYEARKFSISLSTSPLVAVIKVPPFESTSELILASIYVNAFIEVPAFESTSELTATIHRQIQIPAFESASELTLSKITPGSFFQVTPFESQSQLVVPIQPQLKVPAFESLSEAMLTNVSYGTFLNVPAFESVSEITAKPYRLLVVPAFLSISAALVKMQPQLACPAFASTSELSIISIFNGVPVVVPVFESISELIVTLQPQLACPTFTSFSELIMGNVLLGTYLICPPFESTSELTATLFDVTFLPIPAFESTSALISTMQAALICPPFESVSTLIMHPQRSVICPAFESETTIVIPTIWDGTAWKAWIEENGKRVTRLYYFTLTGDAEMPAIADIGIPISSFQCRRKNGDPTFLSVVIPWPAAYQTAIEARTHGIMQISMAYSLDGVEQYREIICLADYESMRDDKGSRNQSVTLTGHKTESFVRKTIDLMDVNTISNDNGDYRYRCGSCNMYLNPGDTARYAGNEITVAQIVYMVAIEGKNVMVSMDVEEAAT